MYEVSSLRHFVEHLLCIVREAIKTKKAMPFHKITSSALLLLTWALLLCTKSNSYAPSMKCSDQFQQISTKRSLTKCKNLNTLGAELSWKLDERNHSQIQIHILFGAPLNGGTGWVAWGVNPNGEPQMVGTRALIGIVQPNGSFAFGTYNITADTKIGCELRPSEIEPKVWDLEMDYAKGFFMVSAKLGLAAEDYNVSRLTHVWQVGYDVAAEERRPKMHPTALQNVDSTETLNMKTGKSSSVGHHRQHLRTVHGILNIVGWGTFLPVGAIISRYFKIFPVQCKPWYTLHVTCQLVGYVLGTAGWSLGLWLGHASRHYSFGAHRLLGIFIFTFTTLQVLALQFRPKGTDEYRRFWDMYHHLLGYALIIAISVNIFQGIDILKPDHTWKWAYIALLIVLASVVAGLEILTWTMFVIHRTKEKEAQIVRDKEKTTQKAAGEPATDQQAQDSKGAPLPSGRRDMDRGLEGNIGDPGPKTLATQSKTVALH